jgi:hypothetical protein
MGDFDSSRFESVPCNSHVHGHEEVNKGIW